MTSLKDARTRILLYFLIGIALPSALLGYLAVRGIQNDRALLERERRNELERVAAELQNAVDERLDALAEAVRLSLSSGSDAEDGIRLLAASGPIEAVFAVGPGPEVRVVASEGLRFRKDAAETAPPASSGDFAASLREARELEFQAADLKGALALYGRALAQAPDERGRAETLIASARVERKVGRLAEAHETYRRIRVEHADLQMVGGMPFGAVAALEQATVLLEAGDSAGAARVLMSHHEELVGGRWVLTPAQFDFVTGSAMQPLTLLSESAVLAWPRDTLEVLRKEENVARDRAMALLAFEDAAARLFEADGQGVGRRSLTAAGRYFHTVLLETPPTEPDIVRWGFVVDLTALAAEALAETLSASASPLAWRLRADGDVLAGSPDPAAAGALTVTAPLRAFPAASVEIGHAPEAGSNFLTSRRAVYLYAFLLLAGILAFGLTLTIRSVGRELELARLKSDFVSTVSHEFRSPLTAIRQVAEMLRDGRVPSVERRRRYYGVLVEQSERLSTLVEGVLDFASLEGGQRRMDLESVEVGSLIEGTVSDARHRVAHRGFEIRSLIEGGLPALRIDAAAIRQALGNLIDNGVKYSGASRELIVRAARDDGEVVISVQDFGVGISPEERGRVFERFYRGGHELTRTVKGTGLGLTLVKQIVEAHGGAVEIESEPGLGSTFTIRLPTGVEARAAGRNAS